MLHSPSLVSSNSRPLSQSRFSSDVTVALEVSVRHVCHPVFLEATTRSVRDMLLGIRLDKILEELSSSQCISSFYVYLFRINVQNDIHQLESIRVGSV